jgi:hypothetical protein
VPDASADERPDQRGADDDSEQEERQLQAVELEEDARG